MNTDQKNTEFFITEVSAGNKSIYYNLAQAYEAEFSSITQKNPDLQGLYPLDTRIEEDVRGFLIHSAEHTFGFAAAEVLQNGDRDLREFYIIPTMRRRKIGTLFASRVFLTCPGRWTVKQLRAAHYATKFWHRALSELGIIYEESVLKDDYWGEVVMQSFEVQRSDTADAMQITSA